MNKKRARQPTNAEPTDPAQSTTCQICFDEYSLESNHRICALPCGHVYGSSCIQKWIKSYKSCPMCKVKTQPRKIIKLFAASISVKDNADTVVVQKKLDELKKQHNELNTSYIRARTRADIATSKNNCLEQHIEQMKREKRSMLAEINRLKQLASRCTCTTTGNRNNISSGAIPGKGVENHMQQQQQQQNVMQHSSSSSSSVNKSNKSILTKEQRERMARNKAQALKARQQKQLLMQQQQQQQQQQQKQFKKPVPPVVLPKQQQKNQLVSFNAPSQQKRRDQQQKQQHQKQQHQQQQQQQITTATTTASSLAAVVASSSSSSSTSTTSLTTEQRERMRFNKAKALEKSKRQQQPKPPPKPQPSSLSKPTTSTTSTTSSDIPSVQITRTCMKASTKEDIQALLQGLENDDDDDWNNSQDIVEENDAHAKTDELVWSSPEDW